MYQVNEGKGGGCIFFYLINIHDQIYLFTLYWTYLSGVKHGNLFNKNKFYPNLGSENLTWEKSPSC